MRIARISVLIFTDYFYFCAGMPLKKFFAYLVCAFTGGGALLGLVVFAWGVKVGRIYDFKSFVGPWIFIIWWGWVAISVYREHIYLPRVRARQRKIEAKNTLDQLIRSGSAPLGFVIEELRNAYPLLMEPRYRSSSDPTFDRIVELEEHAFAITLFEKEGAIVRWEIR